MALIVGLLLFGAAVHGLFDFFHPHILSNPGVPAWWPPFCLAFDVVMAAYLAWLLSSKTLRADSVQ